MVSTDTVAADGSVTVVKAYSATKDVMKAAVTTAIPTMVWLLLPSLLLSSAVM